MTSFQQRYFYTAIISIKIILMNLLNVCLIFGFWLRKIFESLDYHCLKIVLKGLNKRLI